MNIYKIKPLINFLYRTEVFTFHYMVIRNGKSNFNILVEQIINL